MENYLFLDNDEKAEAIKSHLKNLQLQKYGVELLILQETDLGNEDAVTLLNSQLLEFGSRENTLKSELNKFI